mgnify:CR=1 FL=1
MVIARALLVLGRVSNLSTVWSNCLCAWVLGGTGQGSVFTALMIGLSLMYIGGMYLNDYCDVNFDKEFRPERPIPSGHISQRAVLLLTIGMLGSGYALVTWVNLQVALLGALLLSLIVVYNIVHKKTGLGVLLMAGCRTGVYLMVGAASLGGLNSEVVWASILMFLYVLGITCLARTESTGGALSKTGLIAILVSLGGMLLAGAMNSLWIGAFLSFGALVGWIYFAFSKSKVNDRLIVGKTIGPLVAGICLVDWTILSGMRQFSLTTVGFLVAFFLIAIIGQRSIPAT